jgi:hypothetical protein
LLSLALSEALLGKDFSEQLREVEKGGEALVVGCCLVETVHRDEGRCLVPA